jgi:hypothetical protein
MAGGEWSLMVVVSAWDEEGMRRLFTSEEEGMGPGRHLSLCEEEVVGGWLAAVTRGVEDGGDGAQVSRRRKKGIIPSGPGWATRPNGPATLLGRRSKERRERWVGCIHVWAELMEGIGN